MLAHLTQLRSLAEREIDGTAIAMIDLGERLEGLAVEAIPLVVVGTLVVVVLAIAHRILTRSTQLHHDAKFRHQLIMAGLTLVGLLALLFALPIDTDARNGLLGLIGIVVSAAIALSSTNLLGNAMAGVMLRVVKNFHYGDFVRVGDHFGRVSERSLFHTEIQTEDRDLTTLPNLYLISNPVTVVRSSGTVLSATVSLGYDAPRKRVETELIAAGVEAGLEEPFVQVLELGDFSVNYRLAGLLKDVTQIVSARSKLRKRMLDQLHRAGIEIVSPTFMNTLARKSGELVLPVGGRSGGDDEAQPEAVIFDKAEEATALEKLRTDRAACAAALADARGRLAKASTDEEKAALEAKCADLERQAEELEASLAAAEPSSAADGSDEAKQ